MQLPRFRPGLTTAPAAARPSERRRSSPDGRFGRSPGRSGSARTLASPDVRFGRSPKRSDSARTLSSPDRRFGRPAAAIAALLLCAAAASAQPPRAPLPLEPEGSRGEAIFPAFEGWYRNADGSSTILLGYFSRNEEAVDVPIGPDNRIEPGGPDLGQPTHFLPRRAWGVFAINVPADAGAQRFTWTLTANNQRSEVSFWLNPPYFVDPFLNRANGNTPPRLRVGDGPELQGPPVTGVSATYAASVGETIELRAAARDEPLTNPPPPRRRGRPRPPLTLTWRLYRGPAEVVFETGNEDGGSGRHEFADLAGGETRTFATFAEPGDYRLMVTANDVSGNGGGGDQCCWTTGFVDVTVR